MSSKIFNTLVMKLSHRGLLNFLSDKAYLKLMFKVRLGKKLNLKNPKSYNEKLQWLKLYDRNPEYVKIVDKFDVKTIIEQKIGEQYIIPTLGVWDSFDEIDFDTLPNQFVLKCTHDSGGLVISKDKTTLDKVKAKEKIESSLKTNYFWHGREWPYKNLKPRIIAEKYMVDESGYELKDYKFFCFDGKVKALFIAKDRQKEGEETKFDFFDENFNHLPFTNGHPNSTPPFFKPDKFKEMKEIAEKLSAGFAHIRVDLYNINGQIYFGELTLFHWSGMTPFEPEEWDYKFGSWIDLQNIKKV